MKFNIEIGIQKRPIKTVIMGCEGIGKSTLASQEESYAINHGRIF